MNFDGFEAVMYTGAGQDRLPSRPLPEAQIMELRAAVDRYKQFCPFSVGDLVTPRDNAAYRNKGGIHIVAEVFTASPVRDTTTSSGDWPYYGKLDMRVIYLADNGETVPHMVESWLFEPYTGEGATAQEEPAEATAPASEPTTKIVFATGWMECHGGECPVPADTIVEIEKRNGTKTSGIAGDFRWTHKVDGNPGRLWDIVAYRVIF